MGGWKVVALLRLSPIVPYSASNYLYGLSGIGLLPYTAASAIFSFPGTVAYVWLGYLGTETIGGAERTPAEWTLLIVGIAATVARDGVHRGARAEKRCASKPKTMT